MPPQATANKDDFVSKAIAACFWVGGPLLFAFLLLPRFWMRSVFHTQLVSCTAAITWPMRRDFVDINFVVGTGVTLILLPLLTTAAVLTRGQWHRFVSARLSKENMYLRHIFQKIVLQSLEPEIIVSLNILIASTVFEALMPATGPEAGDGLFVKVFGFSSMLLYQCCQLGLIAPATRKLTCIAHVMFCFSMGVLRLHAAGHGVFGFWDTLRYSMFTFTVPTLLNGAVAVLPVLAIASHMDHKFSKPTPKHIATRILSQYAANALFTWWSVCMAEWLALDFVEVHKTATPLFGSVKVAMFLLMATCTVALVGFIVLSIKSLFRLKPFCNLDWRSPNHIQVQLGCGDNLRQVGFYEEYLNRLVTDLRSLFMATNDRRFGNGIEVSMQLLQALRQLRHLLTHSDATIDMLFTLDVPMKNMSTLSHAAVKVDLEIQAFGAPTWYSAVWPQSTVIASIRTDSEVFIPANSRLQTVKVPLRLTFHGSLLSKLVTMLVSGEMYHGWRVMLYINRGEFLPRLPFQLYPSPDTGGDAAEVDVEEYAAMIDSLCTELSFEVTETAMHETREDWQALHHARDSLIEHLRRAGEATDKTESLLLAAIQLGEYYKAGEACEFPEHSRKRFHAELTQCASMMLVMLYKLQAQSILTTGRLEKALLSVIGMVIVIAQMKLVEDIPEGVPANPPPSNQEAPAVIGVPVEGQDVVDDGDADLNSPTIGRPTPEDKDAVVVAEGNLVAVGHSVALVDPTPPSASVHRESPLHLPTADSAIPQISHTSPAAQADPPADSESEDPEDDYYEGPPSAGQWQQAVRAPEIPLY